MEIGYYIRILREQKGLSREAVAAELRLSLNTYAKIETGKRPITLQELQMLARVLENDFRAFAPTALDSILLQVQPSTQAFDPAGHVLVKREFFEELLAKLTELTALLNKG